jgi:pimeloyl-ACP methyl ester carboxylesterase
MTAGDRPVVLLHGFPQTVEAWSGVSPLLTDAGLRPVALELHGASLADAADEVLAGADELGIDRFDVVGHDWGGAVAWKLAADRPDRLRTASVVATPHPRAFTRSLAGVQALRSWYAAAFRLPALPEAVLRARGGAVLRAMLVASGLDAEHASAYTAAMVDGGRLPAALAWYRANGPGAATSVGPSLVPTLYVWPSGDVALGRRAAERTAEHVDAPYRFEVLDGAPHWVPERRPEALASLVVAHLGTVDAP